MDALDEGRGVKGIGFAGAGTAAAHIDGHDGGGIGNDKRYPGVYGNVMGVADAQAGNVGEAIGHGAVIAATPGRLATFMVNGQAGKQAWGRRMWW